MKGIVDNPIFWWNSSSTSGHSSKCAAGSQELCFFPLTRSHMHGSTPRGGGGLNRGSFSIIFSLTWCQGPLHVYL